MCKWFLDEVLASFPMPIPMSSRLTPHVPRLQVPSDPGVRKELAATSHHKNRSSTTWVETERKRVRDRDSHLHGPSREILAASRRKQRRPRRRDSTRSIPVT